MIFEYFIHKCNIYIISIPYPAPTNSFLVILNSLSSSQPLFFNYYCFTHAYTLKHITNLLTPFRVSAIKEEAQHAQTGSPGPIWQCRGLLVKRGSHVHVFRVHHLRLVNLSGGLSLEKADPPSFSAVNFSITFHLVLETYKSMLSSFFLNSSSY